MKRIGTYLAFFSLLLAFPGLAFAQNFVTTSDGRIMRTTDGGETWLHQLNVRDSFTRHPATAIWHDGDDTLWVANSPTLNGGNNNHLKFLYSIDSGKTYQSTGTLYGHNSRSNVNEIFFFKDAGRKNGVISISPVGTSRDYSYTQDGGATWNTNRRTVGNRVSVSDANTAYGVTTTQITKTTDTGKSFSNVFSLPSFNSVEKAGNVVIIVGDGGIIRASTDNGNTWESMNDGTGITGGQNFNDLPNVGTSDLHDIELAPNSNVMLVCGENGYLARSTDGGLNWTQIQLQNAQGNNNTERVREIYFVNDSTVWTMGDDFGSQASSHNLYWSRDTGRSWTQVVEDSVKRNPDRRYRIQSMHFANDTVGYVAYNRGCTSTCYEILYTNNGGLTWRQTSGKPQADVIQEFLVYDLSTAIAFGNRSNGRVWMTQDTGRTWTHISTMESDAIYVTNDSIIAAADNGISLSTDSAKSWTTLLSGGNYEDILGGWVVGRRATALRTSDWSNFDTIPAIGYNLGLFENVFALNDDTVIVVGRVGTILKTEDAGNTWDYKGNPNVLTNFNAVQMTTNTEGWLLGNENGQGQLFKTTDGGDSWTKVADFPQQANELAFLDQQNGMIIFDRGMLIKTTDGGQSWEEVYTGTGEDLIRISYKSPLVRPYTGTVASLNADTAYAMAGGKAMYAVTAQDFQTIYGAYGHFTWDNQLSLDTVMTSASGLTYQPMGNGLTYQLRTSGYSPSNADTVMTLVFDVPAGATMGQVFPVAYKTDTLHGYIDNMFHTRKFTAQDAAVKVGQAPVSIADQKDPYGLRIFPNPAQDFVQVELENMGNGASLRILSATGQTVEELTLRNGSQQINLRGLDAGLYFFEVNGDQGVSRTRLVVR